MARAICNVKSLDTAAALMIASIVVFNECGCRESHNVTAESVTPETEAFGSQAMTSGGGERRMESPEAFSVLTQEESLGLACLAAELRPAYGICKATNPIARVEIARILKMDENRGVEVRDYQIATMYCLGYVGEDEDALAVEHFLLTGHKYTDQPFGKKRFLAAFTGIALMARRDLPEAKRIMADIVRPEYWKDIAVPVYYFKGLDALEEDLVLAVYAAAIADGGPDKQLRERIIEGSQHKAAMSKFLQPDLVERELLKIIESESHPVTDRWRAKLQNHFRVLYTPLMSGQSEEGRGHPK